MKKFLNLESYFPLQFDRLHRIIMPNQLDVQNVVFVPVRETVKMRYRKLKQK